MKICFNHIRTHLVGDTYEEEESNGVEVESIQNGVDLNTADSALKDQVTNHSKKSGTVHS